MRNPDPRGNQKAGVVSQKMQIFFPYLGTPSNKTVSWPKMPGSGRPCQTGNGSVMGEGYILKVFSNRLAIAQVMILGNEAIEKLLKRAPSDLPKCDW